MSTPLDITINQSGITTAIKVFASAEEQSASGNYRTVYLKVWAEPQDGYTGKRDAEWTFEYEDAYGDQKELESPSATIITSTMSIFSGPITVYVSPGNSYADTLISFTAVLISPSVGRREISGSITMISGLSVVSDVLITSTKDIFFGDNCQISWVPASESFHYKLTFSVGSSSSSTQIISPRTNSEYVYSNFTIPLDWATNIPNSVSAAIRVTLTQYEDSYGRKTIGTPSSSSFIAAVPSNIVPEIDSCTVSVDNSDNSVINQWGIAIAGFSKVNIKASANGIYGSKIVSYSISGPYSATIPGETLDYTGVAISSSGNKQFILTCIDSRGRSSDTYTSSMINFIPYTLPKVERLSMSKNTYGDDDKSNDRMVAESSWEYDTIGGRNSITAKIYYKLTSAEDWTEHSGSLKNGIAFVLTDFVPNEESSYNFKVVITDALGGKSEKDAFSSTVTVLLDFKSGGDGLGIGKICEKPGMEVSMDATFFNEVYIKSRQQTLEDYIRSTMSIIGNTMYGTAEPDVYFANKGINPVPGQIYYKKVTNNG